MHQGKHQEYEKRLHDALIAQTATTNSSPNNKLGESNKIPAENNNTNSTQNGPEKNKEAWPSLSTSPVNKEAKTNKSGSNKENVAKKTKSEKTKNKKTAANNNNSSSNNSSSTNSTTNSSSSNSNSSSGNSSTLNNNGNSNSNSSNNNSNNSSSQNSDKISSENNTNGKDRGFNLSNDVISNQTPNVTMSADEELNLIQELENDALSNDEKADTPSLR